MKMYDLSPPLRPGLAVWPGDTPFSLSRTLSTRRGDSIDLAGISLSLHAGAHLDAPSHVLPEAPTVDRIDLATCLGPAYVLHVEAAGAIGADVLTSKIAPDAKRLLLRANPGRNRNRFETGFNHLAPDAARLIVRRGIRLVGTDGPSVDAFDSEDLPAHRILGEAGVLILENLVLDQVPEGLYDLVALPLRIVGGEASPVRAVLIGKRDSPAAG